MNLEDTVRDAILAELDRQAASGRELTVKRMEGDRVDIDGEIDLGALAMVIVGSLAGGP